MRLFSPSAVPTDPGFFWGNILWFFLGHQRGRRDHLLITLPSCLPEVQVGDLLKFNLQAEGLRSCCADIWHSAALTGLVLLVSHSVNSSRNSQVSWVPSTPCTDHATLCAEGSPPRNRSFPWTFQSNLGSESVKVCLPLDSTPQSLVRFSFQRYPEEFVQELR